MSFSQNHLIFILFNPIDSSSPLLIFLFCLIYFVFVTLRPSSVSYLPFSSYALESKLWGGFYTSPAEKSGQHIIGNGLNISWINKWLHESSTMCLEEKTSLYLWKGLSKKTFTPQRDMWWPWAHRLWVQPYWSPHCKNFCNVSLLEWWPHAFTRALINVLTCLNYSISFIHWRIMR